MNRKGTYLLNNAFIKEYPSNGSYDYTAFSWTINYTNGRKHTLCAAIPVKKSTEPSTQQNSNGRASSSEARANLNSRRALPNPYERKKVWTISDSKNSHKLISLKKFKKWIQAIQEHIRYSDSHAQLSQNENSALMPLESLQQNLNVLRFLIYLILH